MKADEILKEKWRENGVHIIVDTTLLLCTYVLRCADDKVRRHVMKLHNESLENAEKQRRRSYEPRTGRIK